MAVPGLLLAAGGPLWLSRLEAGAAYGSDLMVPLFGTSAGLGLAFVPLTLTVVHDVDQRGVGAASAVMNTAQRLGAALGLAVPITVATSAASSAGTGTTAAAPAHGYTTAFAAAAGLLMVGAVVTAVAIAVGPQGARRDVAAPASEARPQAAPPGAGSVSSTATSS